MNDISYVVIFDAEVKISVMGEFLGITRKVEEEY